MQTPLRRAIASATLVAVLAVSPGALAATTPGMHTFTGFITGPNGQRSAGFRVVLVDMKTAKEYQGPPTDASGLYGVRLKLAKPDEHVVLPEIISKEPLAPFVRQGDDQWFNIVKWVHFAMVNAEEINVTKANVDEQMKSENPDIKRLLGAQDNFGEQLGLTKDWAYRVIKLVGNYGEVFDRNVGQGSPLKITRGLNNLWTKGGLQYAPPIR